MLGDRAVVGVRRRWAVGPAAFLAMALLLVGCSGIVDLDTEDPVPSPSPTETEEPARPIATAEEPAAAYSLIASTDPAELAVGVSRAYLVGAQVAVLAPRDDRDAIMRAASIAAAVGAPVLLSGAEDASLDVELLRLGVVGVVTVGAVDLTVVDTTSLVVAPAPEDASELGEMLGASLTEVPMPAAEADDVAALLALAPGEVFAPGHGAPSTSDPSEEADETAETTEATESGSDDAVETTDPASTDPTPAPEPTPVGELPPLAAPERIEGSLVLSDGDPSQLAAIANARAVGAEVARTSGDVRSDPETIELLSEMQPATVVGLGTGMGDEDQFVWRTQTAATGAQLGGGGQLVFDGKRYVALYGSPVTPALGVLGEQGVEETIERAARLAGRYDELTEDTVVPALEIIVTVASGSAGDDGNYSNEWSSDTFLPLIEAAGEAGQYVVLDFQPGRTSFLDQIRDYEDLLAYPHVGVALDPEWRLEPDEVHLTQIGSVDIAEVNQVVDYVADFVQENRLPQKLVILHQFQLRMITDRPDLDTSRTEVALLIHADGQGSQGAKQETWRALHKDAPEGVYWGWKNFIDEDSPTLTPEETYTRVDPIPDFVSYQ